MRVRLRMGSASHGGGEGLGVTPETRTCSLCCCRLNSLCSGRDVAGFMECGVELSQPRHETTYQAHRLALSPAGHLHALGTRL